MKPEAEQKKQRKISDPRALVNRIHMRWHIFAYFLGFCAFLLLLLWLLQIVYLDAFYRQIKTDQIARIASTLDDNIDNRDLPDLIVRMAQSNDVCITVAQVHTVNRFLLGVDVLEKADILGNCVIHHMPDDEYYRFYELAEKNGGSYSLLFSRQWFANDEYQSDRFIGRVPEADQGLSSSLIYVKLVENDAGDTIMLLLNSNISPVDSTREALRVQLIYITLILVFVALLLSLLISRHLASPIASINKSAAKLAREDFSGGFADGGYLEISELASTLNYVSAELSRADKLQQELVANISHDLRTPLTMIGGYAEAMRDIPGENNKENIQLIIDETARLTSLVNNVLDLSKLNAGIVNNKPCSFDLNADLAATAENYNRLLAHEGYQIHYTPGPPCPVYADQSQISQVTGNLLNNALTYTGPDKQVTLRLEQQAGQARVSVIDNGPGISPEQLADIWKRYYRVSESHRRSARGSGLGLSIVKKLVELNHGDCGVSSQVGQGSVFWYSLPLAQPPAEEGNGK
ncbi:MAG: HAMP domain-containing histidine kinase [Firmicutes bacterium]|nr:HAMP domain-containing histidine kinase [Bacillota bacterium]